MNHHDPITIGTDNRGNLIEWSFPTVSNFNMLFEGQSGGGKTWTIHQMTSRVYVRGATFHIVDVKGDFRHDNFVDSGCGHYVKPDDFNIIKFDYFDGASINPLQVPRNKEGGGVLMTVESMKQLVKQFAPNTGIKQLGYLTDILREVYQKKGIDHDDMETWGRPAPTLDDVLAQVDLVASMITAKLPIGTVEEILESYGKARRKGESVIQKAHGTEIPLDNLRQEIAEVCDELIDQLKAKAVAHINYDNLSKNSNSDEMWEHWSRESLFGLRTTIRNMCDSRLFTGNQSRAINSKINVYDITELSPPHQQIIMRIVAARVFAMGVQETKKNNAFNPRYPSHIMIADEGKHIKEISQSPLSPFNRIGTEGRGFGVGAWLGVQQPDQLTSDLLKNFATFMLLKTPESTYNEVCRMFGVKPSLLKQLVPRQNMLFSAGGAFSLVDHFKDN
jgi:hypothetical protein